MLKCVSGACLQLKGTATLSGKVLNDCGLVSSSLVVSLNGLVD